MRLGAKSMVAIDFGSRSIKIVEGSFKNGKLNISNRVFRDLPNGVYENGYIKDEDILIEIVDSALRLNNIKRRDALAVISSTDILTRNISLPSLEPDEIEGVIKYKITDYIPIDLENYVVQYIDQGKFMDGGNEKVKLFIIAMPKKIIEMHFNFLKEVDLNPKILDFQSNAIRKLLLFSKNNKLGKNIASVDIGSFSTKITVIKSGNIEIARVIPLGIRDILGDINIDLTEREILEKLFSLNNIKEKSQISVALEMFLTNIFKKINMIFSYYNSLDSNNIDLILLQGSITKVDKILEEFEKHLGIKTVNINSLEEKTNSDLCLYSNSIGSLIKGGSL